MYEGEFGHGRGKENTVFPLPDPDPHFNTPEVINGKFDKTFLPCCYLKTIKGPFPTDKSRLGGIHLGRKR